MPTLDFDRRHPCSRWIASSSGDAEGASDTLAVVGSSSDYRWFDSPSAKESSTISRQDLAHSISELAFRAAFLSTVVSSVDGVNKAETPPLDCSTGFQAAIDLLKSVVKNLGDLPGVDIVLKGVLESLQQVINTLGGEPSSRDLNTSLNLLKGISKALGATEPGVKVIPGFEDTIKTAVFSINSVAECLEQTIEQTPPIPGNVAVLAFQQEYCYPIADLYRSMVGALLENAVYIPDGSSDEMKRSMTGILAVLDIMSKSSIAANNADLLKVEPIFAADMLEQFRDVYVSLAERNEQKLFANAGLTVAIGASNALEACLRIAKDPTSAIDDLKEDLGFENVSDEVTGAPNQTTDSQSQ
ncbi:hypothetical protein DFQ26_009468 [Actinomortierella ambigua]|nr:hypothetical protein DFQ26_009468 [Actinomortierella ambigua]